MSCPPGKTQMLFKREIWLGAQRRFSRKIPMIKPSIIDISQEVNKG